MRKLVLTVALAMTIAAPARAAVIHYTATLLPEVLGATGSGFVDVFYDDVAHDITLLNATWTGLSGTTTVAHIHCCTAAPGTGTIGVAVTPGTLPGFPVGLTAGTYNSPVIDLDLASSFTSGFVTDFAGGVLANAPAALVAGILQNRAYFNVHSSTFPGGEIRGFLAVAAVPEPASLTLLGLGLAVAAMRRRRAR